MHDIIKQINSEFERNVDKEYQIGCQWYFKESVKCIGVRTKIVDQIAQKYFKQIKHLLKDNIFELCRQLLSKQTLEESSLALNWVFRLKNQFESKDFFTFELWLKKYITNWGTCDDLCTHPLGHLLIQYPEHLPRLKEWANSSNMWLRRASAVSLIQLVRIPKHIDFALGVADILLLDKQDLVQKGYGWMLKEMSRKNPQIVYNYVIQNKKLMPRTALRYAIEKLSKEKKKEAMAP